MKIEEAKTAGERIMEEERATIQKTSTQSMIQTEDSTGAMNGNLESLGLAEVPDQQATLGRIESGDQDTTPEGRIPEAGGKIDTDRIATDKMVIEQREVRAGKEEETMELRELAVMAMGGGPEDTARRFQTWGIPLQATPQSLNQVITQIWTHQELVSGQIQQRKPSRDPKGSTGIKFFQKGLRSTGFIFMKKVLFIFHKTVH